MKLHLHGLREKRQGRCTRALFSVHFFLRPTTAKMALDVRPFGGIQEQEQVEPACSEARRSVSYRMLMCRGLRGVALDGGGTCILVSSHGQ